MERRLRLRKQRRRFAIALVVSVGFHALLFALLKIHVPDPTERRDSARQITLIQLPQDITERPLEVVALAELPAGPRTRSDPAASPTTPASDPGVVAETIELAATLELSGDATGAGELQLAAAEAVEETAMPLRMAQRGVVLKRAEGGSSTRLEGVIFRPASRAARDAERDRRGGGIGGLGGIGVTILGGAGGDCNTPNGGSTLLPGTLGRPRGLGGLPTIGTAGGIVPAPSGTGLIDRFVPGGRR